MFQELSDILLDKVHPAIYSGMTAVTAALEKHQAVLYKDRIVQLRMDANNREPLTLCDEAIQITFDQVRALLQQMHIELEYDNLNMDRLASILEGLLFEPSDNDQEYLLALEAGEDIHDTFCEVLATYLQCDPIELMDVVLSVSTDTVLAIREKIEQNISYTEKAETGVSEATQLVNAHQKLVGGVLTIGMESLQNGIEVGTSAEEMVKQSRERLLEMAPDDMADNLLSIAIVAKTPRDALQDEVMFLAEDIIHDPFDIQKVYRRLTKRIGELPSENTP